MEDKLLGLTAQIVSAHVVSPCSNFRRLSAKCIGRTPRLDTSRLDRQKLNLRRRRTNLSLRIISSASTAVKASKCSNVIFGPPDEYRAKWNLPGSYPMVAPEYAATRSQLAKDAGLGRKAKASPPPKKPAKKSGLARMVEASPQSKRSRPKKG